MLVHRDPFKRRVKLTSRGYAYANFPPTYPINLDRREVFPRFDVDFSSVPRLRHDRSIERRRGSVRGCTWNGNARTGGKIGGLFDLHLRSSITERSGFDRRSRLIGTKYPHACKYSWCNKIYFFFSSNRERTLVKWDVKMRICCFDSTQYVTYYFRRVFQYFSFLFDRCTRRYITCKILDTSKKWLNTKNIYI